MVAGTAQPDAAAPARRRRSPWTVLRENVVWLVAVLALVYLLLPNLVVVLFSFNKPNGRFNYTWQRFSLDAWLHPVRGTGDVRARSACRSRSAWRPPWSATLLGTLIAFALAGTASAAGPGRTC